MFNSLRSRIRNMLQKTSKSIPKLPEIPMLPSIQSLKPKITIGDFKLLASQQMGNLKQIKLSTVTMPLTHTIKIVGKSTGQASWFLLRLFFRTKLGIIIKWTCGLTSLSFLGYTYGTVETHEAIVDKAYHKIVKGETRLIVIDKHGGVYHVENAIMWGQMNADGLFAKIKPENRYIFRTFGISIPYVGLHKKIVQIVDEL